MWQSHWQPRRNPLSHNDLRCVEYFANPGKVGKELDGEFTRTVRFQNARVRKCPLFLEKFDPFRQLCWRAEGGCFDAKMHDIRALLAFRQFVALAGWLMV